MKNVNSRDMLMYYHAFNVAGGFGPQKYGKLLAYFKSIENAWLASLEELVAAGISEKLSATFVEKRRNINPEDQFMKLGQENIIPLSINDPAYPPLLRKIHSAPPLLYARGNIDSTITKSLAVVGSRKFSAYGQRVTQSLTHELVRAGLAIVSGLALGIDAIAHRSALEADGVTIALLGSGLDDNSLFPRENFNLARNIISRGGALFSEYPPGTPSFKQNFPARNRLMAGVSLGTLVIEAALGSGSLITAENALDFNREVFAVPGQIFSPQSEGTNYLIKSGAKLVSSAKDILEELHISADSDPKTALRIYEPKSSDEKIIWKTLSTDPVHVDSLAKLSKLNPATVNSVLAMMEIEGVVKNMGGQNYVKI